MLIMDQVLGCENEFLNSRSSKGADVCANDCPVYDRNICCICWWPRKRAIDSPWRVRKGFLRKGLKLGLVSLGKLLNILESQFPKLLCEETKTSFMEVRMK